MPKMRLYSTTRSSGVALTAFLQVAMEQGAMPDSEKTRRRAYDLYEETLRNKNTDTSSPRLEP